MNRPAPTPRFARQQSVFFAALRRGRLSLVEACLRQWRREGHDLHGLLLDIPSPDIPSPVNGPRVLSMMRCPSAVSGTLSLSDLSLAMSSDCLRALLDRTPGWDWSRISLDPKFLIWVFPALCGHAAPERSLLRFALDRGLLKIGDLDWSRMFDLFREAGLANLASGQGNVSHPLPMICRSVLDELRSSAEDRDWLPDFLSAAVQDPAGTVWLLCLDRERVWPEGFLSSLAPDRLRTFWLLARQLAFPSVPFSFMWVAGAGPADRLLRRLERLFGIEMSGLCLVDLLDPDAPLDPRNQTLFAGAVEGVATLFGERQGSRWVSMPWSSRVRFMRNIPSRLVFLDRCASSSWCPQDGALSNVRSELASLYAQAMSLSVSAGSGLPECAVTGCASALQIPSSVLDRTVLRPGRIFPAQ